MLKNFLYLNTDSLSAYLSSIEGGLQTDIKRETLAEGDATTVSLSVTAQARFERLESLATQDRARTGWITVGSSPDEEFGAVKVRSIIDVDCEIYIPDTIKALSRTSGMANVLGIFETIMPQAEMLGMDVKDMPTSPQISAMRSLVNNVTIEQVLVGEMEDSDWRVAGKLSPNFLYGEIEGIARVVGKVSAVWQKGQWKHLLALPGANLIPRAQRRSLERKTPKEEEAENWLEGPAVMLDLLAVYR